MLKHDRPRHDQPVRLPITTASGEEMRPDQADKLASRYGDIVKYSLVLLVTIGAFYLLYNKLKDTSWQSIQEAWAKIPNENVAIAFALTGLNFCLMTGYDLIAVRYLKKSLPIRNVMAGAVIGYAFSNVFGWLLGGTAVRYRLYRRWGFSPVEIIAFVTILSITFWLGMFLLAGIAFTALPIKLPEDAANSLILSHKTWGWIFLSIAALYLIATAVIRKPIPMKHYRYALPPLKLSVLQLVVSACDFVLTSLVLYMLLPPDITGADEINFSTVLISYLTAMIAVVVTHVPGGVGVLETGLLTMLPDSATAAVVAGAIMFRVVYYLIPAAIAAILWGCIELSWKYSKPPLATPSPAPVPQPSQTD